MSIIPFLDFASPIINKAMSYIPDPEQKAKAQKELMDSLMAWDAMQVGVNVEEAKNANLFVSGWRPAVGWCCCAAFAYKFVIQPFAIFLMIACGSTLDYHTLPNLDWAEMSPVLLGLLGLGGLRSLDKIKGVA